MGSDFEKKASPAVDYDTGVEALRQAQEDGTFVHPTAEEEHAVIRKLDWRLLPMLFILYSFAVLDRSNLGNAKLAGMEKDIDLTHDRYNWLGTIFYIAYILFQWTLITWKMFPPHRVCAFTVFFWGFVATIQATTSSWQGLMVCRFFLGIAEAMFGPGIPLYLTFFYPRELVGFRHGVFISGAALANAYGGALAYGISQIRGALAPWKILFLIEGLPTLLLALAAWLLLPDSLGAAKFLNEREKQVALHFVARGQEVDAGGSGVKWREVAKAFKDPKSFIPGLMYFGCNVSFASLPLFMPTIIAEIGKWSRIQSNGMSAPPYLFCFFFIITICWLSDRYQMRGPFVAFAATTAGIGFVINASTDGAGPRYFSVFLSVCIFGSIAILLAWQANVHRTESKRSGGYAIMYTIGQCGPLLGTNVFPASEKPHYRKGLWISASMCFMVAILAVLLSLYIIWENKKIDTEGDVRETPEADGEDKGASTGIDGKVRRLKTVW